MKLGEDYTPFTIPVDPDDHLPVLDISEALEADKNKIIGLDTLAGDVSGLTLIKGSTVEVSNAEILALKTTPKQILTSGGIDPAFYELYGVLIEFTYVAPAFATDTFLLVTRGATATIVTFPIDILGNTASKKAFLLPVFVSGEVGNNEQLLGATYVYYLTTPTADPTAGGGTLKATPIYRQHLNLSL